MHVQMSCFARHPAFLLLGLLTVLAMGQVQPARAEPCITCRTPDCPKKAGIVAWCGPGSDPMKRQRTGQRAKHHVAQNEQQQAPVHQIPKEDETGVQPTVLDSGQSATPDTTIATTAASPPPPPAATAAIPSSDARLDATGARPALSTSDKPIPAADPAVTPLNIVRAEDSAARRKRNRWIVAGTAAGGGLAITTTVLALVLTSLPSRCGAPLGSVSLNGCN